MAITDNPILHSILKWKNLKTHTSMSIDFTAKKPKTDSVLKSN